jgi:Fe-Mn family superoxide dismutase
MIKYVAQENIRPSGLIGITDAQINDHWNLYVGYVNNVNQLNEELKLLTQSKGSNPLVIADRRRRYGFEYNGMVLHEYYFGNLKAQNIGLDLDSNLYQAIKETWGSFDFWQEDFVNTGKSRGIGWVILYMDPVTKQLTNHFIMDHENGPIAGFAPILVMDVWEHAYMVDHKSGGRADYLKACMANINWSTVQERYR